MTSIENKRFEIREPIRSFLLTVKKYFSYDACALYLISLPDSMHKNEKEEEFKKRFIDGIIIFEYSEKNGENISANKKGRIKFTGIKGRDDKRNSSRKYRFIVEGKEIVVEKDNVIMFTDETRDDKITKELVEITFAEEKGEKQSPTTIYKAIVCDANDTPYKVLKFIGVEDSYGDKKEKKQHWSYDYETRPNKYIVFDKIDEIVGKEVLYIKGEGITAMVARRNFCVRMVENQIYDKNSDGSKNENSIGAKVRGKNDDTERGIHIKCKELIAIPIYDDISNEIKGVVRLDNYIDLKEGRNKVYDDIRELMSRVPDTIEIKGKEDLLRVINELCLQVIGVSLGITDIGSYDQLFQGKKMIDAVINIGNKVNLEIKGNKKIYDLTKHLFFVFQRHTYIGYEEIMIRTMLYIKDVFKSVDMEKYYDLTEKKLIDFMDHEKLMLYSTEKYRDHFMHQFHVFVMGYIFINAIGIDEIKKRINKRLQNVEEYQEIEIDDEGVLRIWVLIALFHDIAYIFQQYDKTMQKFISDNLLVDIPVHIDWGSILSSKKNKASYIDTITELTRFFVSQDENKLTNKTELLKNYIQAIEDNQDHGVLSAILLINLYMKTIEGNYIGDHGSTSKRIVEIYLAALAISMHNSCTYKTLKEDTNIGYICFESFPLEFLLMYCDTAQEWGRKKEVDKVFYDAPVLESITVDIPNGKEINKEPGIISNNEHDKGKNKITQIICKLKYEGLNHPNEEKLNSFFLEKLSKFRSNKISFGVQYAYKTSIKRKTKFYFSCTDDNDRFNQIKIDSAKYLSDYTIRIKFSDGIERVVDFKPFLSKSLNPLIKKYLDESKFSNFSLTDGNLNWNDHNFIFQITDLYKGEIDA